MQVSPLEHHKEPTVSLHHGHSGACSVCCHLNIGILQIPPGMSAPVLQTTFATNPEWSRMTSLHWFPVAVDSRFKTLILTYKANNGSTLTSLKTFIKPFSAR